MTTVPDFDDSGLGEIANAFLSHSKAIKYHAKDWSFSRELTEDESERLNVDADGFHGQLRLSIWPDRVLWFRLCKGRAKNGWDFLLTFQGDASQLTPDQLVEQLISSMAADRSNLLTIWQNVAPEIECSESKA